MCYVCNCFAWTLDLIQRVITFALSCILSFAVCCGLSIAIIAGIAYGYNYCMAEWLTFTRSDVTVYMRRGQFLDRPDLRFPISPNRRMGDETDLFSSNTTTDYQEEKPPSDTKPLSNTWVKAEDTRKYAEKLTKYSTILDEFVKKEHLDQPAQVEREKLGYFMLNTPPARFISIAPNPAMSTTMWRSGSSEIIMRKFQPIGELTPAVITHTKDYDYVNLDKSRKAHSKEAEKADQVAESVRSTISEVPMRSWGTTTYRPPVIADYPTDVDEENVVYRPV